MSRRSIPRVGFNQAGRLTAQQALIAKNQQVGNNHIKNMQGTTRNLYHFLPVDGRKTYDFFKQLNKFAFPFTNIDQNKLAAGETLALQRAYFAYMIQNPINGEVTLLQNLESSAISSQVHSGVWNFVSGNQNITKDFFVASFQSSFNKDAKFLLDSVYKFDTLATLLENVDFYSTLQLGTMPVIANAHLGLVIEGVGSILNLKTNA